MVFANQPDPVDSRREAIVGVIDSQVQAKLGSRGKHSIGLVGPLRDEVINQNPRIGAGSVEDDRFEILDRASGVDAGHDALAGRFFIACGAVDLSGKIETLDPLGFEGMPQLGGIDGIVLDRIARADHLGLVETWD